MKNKIVSIAILIFVAALLLPQTGMARKGVGIVWGTETEIVNEGSTHCIQYGIYNPWDEDVYAILGVSGGLGDIITTEESEAKLIPAGTLHDNAIPVDLCFEIAGIYEKDCIINGIVCEKKCEEPEVSFEGRIEVMEETTGAPTGKAGSATSLGVSVPLTLKVRCDPCTADWTPIIYIVAIVVALLLIGTILYRRRR